MKPLKCSGCRVLADAFDQLARKYDELEARYERDVHGRPSGDKETPLTMEDFYRQIGVGTLESPRGQSDDSTDDT